MFFFPSRGSVFDLGKRFVSGEPSRRQRRNEQGCDSQRFGPENKDLSCESQARRVWGYGDLGMRLEDVVPVVLCGTKTADRGIESDHLFRHGVARGIRIKAAI